MPVELGAMHCRLSDVTEREQREIVWFADRKCKKWSHGLSCLLLYKLSLIDYEMYKMVSVVYPCLNNIVCFKDMNSFRQDAYAEFIQNR